MKIWEDKLINNFNTLVIIGPNGSGKTRYGINLAKWNDCEHIGALRNIALPASLPMKPIDQAKSEFDQRISRSRSNFWESSNEIDILFAKLMAEDAASATKYRNENYKGNNPSIETTRIMELKSIWEELFPERNIEFDGYVPKIKSSYSIESDYLAMQMSDGEKVALYLLGRVLNSEKDIIIVDEPEVHFHSKLAVKFWDAVEASRKKKKFVYVTHNLEFALSRSNPIFLVVKPGLEPILIEKASNLPTETSMDLLAAASLSIFAKRIIFCEGIADKSKDIMLLSAWFNSKETVIVPLNSCKNVIEAVLSYKKTDIIQGLEIIGIIDQDYASIEALDAIKEDVFVLPVHEIESLLLNESIIEEVLLNIGKESEEVKEIISQLYARAGDMYNDDIINKTISERYKSDVAFRLNYAIRGIKSSSDGSDQEKQHLEIVEKLAAITHDVYSKIKTEVTEAKDKGYSEILRIMPGKPLLSLLVKTVGLTQDAYITLVCKLVKENNEKILSVLAANLPTRDIK